VSTVATLRSRSGSGVTLPLTIFLTVPFSFSNTRASPESKNAIFVGFLRPVAKTSIFRLGSDNVTDVSFSNGRLPAAGIDADAVWSGKEVWNKKTEARNNTKGNSNNLMRINAVML
jgi:hypothetical protein